MDCNIVINEYLSWLKGNFSMQSFGNDCIITTPFLDPNGDSIEIKAIIDSDQVVLTDDGETYDYLFLSGIDLFGKSNIRRNNLELSLHKNNAFLYNQNEIAVRVDKGEDFGNAMNRLIRAITSIQHLIYTIKEVPFRTFKDEVADLFFKNKVECITDYIVQGKTAEHKLDFYIERNNKKIVFKTLSTESGPYAKRIAKEAAFIFIDIGIKNQMFYKVSVIDDTKDVWTPESTHILSEYSNRLLKWTNQNEIINLVA
ncbi:MAG TPA: DUF1828 domain-containing protein [Desulfotomaculum sp.]|nr:MAG: hypothetical protein JL56_02735 [Desulfotomaculum sp. BICA1-6]HBX22617.1 DUF1828 domain-containing protein [Desulfotomaculum sp.]